MDQCILHKPRKKGTTNKSIFTVFKIKQFRKNVTYLKLIYTTKHIIYMDIFLDQPGVQYTVYLGQTKTYGKFDDKFVLVRNFTSKYL